MDTLLEIGQLNLTPLMIDTLLVACERQKEKVPFGPTDIKRSFMALVNRGLIIRETVTVHVPHPNPEEPYCAISMSYEKLPFKTASFIFIHNN
jgi:hypothetical protein